MSERTWETGGGGGGGGEGEGGEQSKGLGSIVSQFVCKQMHCFVL